MAPRSLSRATRPAWPGGWGLQEPGRACITPGRRRIERGDKVSPEQRGIVVALVKRKPRPRAPPGRPGKAGRNAGTTPGPLPPGRSGKEDGHSCLTRTVCARDGPVGRGGTGGGRRRHALPSGQGQPVQMAGRPASLARIPGGLQQAAAGQPDQDRIQRPGLQVHLGGQVVAVTPARRIGRSARRTLTACANGGRLR